MKKIIDFAKKTLEDGELVIFPTETVYGLGGNATNAEAIKKIYKIKKRPFNNPLICHFSNFSEIEENFEINDLERRLAKIFWPGPLTLILKKKKTSLISNTLSNNLNYIGCRIPNNLIALKLLNSLSFPLAAPSANLATKISATRTEDLSKNLTKKIFLIKSSKAKYGLESTVIKIKRNNIYILRLGSITEDEISNYFPKNKVSFKKSKNISPGNQSKHYSPNLKLRINVNNVNDGEGLLNFGSNNLISKVCNYNLSKKSNLREAANNFYHFLNLLDKSNSKSIAVAPIPKDGVGKTLNDRLTRAIAKK